MVQMLVNRMNNSVSPEVMSIHGLLHKPNDQDVIIAMMTITTRTSNSAPVFPFRFDMGIIFGNNCYSKSRIFIYIHDAVTRDLPFSNRTITGGENPLGNFPALIKLRMACNR